MNVYQVWEIDPFTAIKDVKGTFKDEKKANIHMEYLARRTWHGYFYVKCEEVIE